MVRRQPHIWTSLNRLCRPSYSLQIFVFEKQNKNKRLFNKTHDVTWNGKRKLDSRGKPHCFINFFLDTTFIAWKQGHYFLSFKCNEVEITTVSFFSQVALLWRQMWPARSRGTWLSQQGWKQCRKAETPSFKSVKKDTLLSCEEAAGSADVFSPLLSFRERSEHDVWKKCKKKRRQRQKENIFQVLQNNLFFFALRRAAQSPVLQTWPWLCISQALHAAFYTQSL